MSDYEFRVQMSVDDVLTAQAAGLATLEAVPALVADAVSMALEQVADHVTLNGPMTVIDEQGA